MLIRRGGGPLSDSPRTHFLQAAAKLAGIEAV
jgi:hypothetical protein